MEYLKKLEKLISNLAAAEIFTKEYTKALEKLEKFESFQANGLFIGRILSFQVADGYAKYYVKSFNEKKVVLVHMKSYLDGYMDRRYSAGGRFGRKMVEKEIIYQDAWANMFS